MSAKRQTTRPGGSKPSLPKAALDDLADILGHKFSDPSLLVRAITHPSALPAHDPGLISNQRLEFLGDRVLGLVIAERLFLRRRSEREGALAPRLNRLVNKRACAEAARQMGLGRFIIMSRHEIARGGRDRDSTLGDVCEAVIAALYLDGGLKRARAFIEAAFAAGFEEANGLKDPKTALQEWAQAHGHGLPDYTVVEQTGPDHAPQFLVEVSIGEGLNARARGASKQAAERAAAARLLEETAAPPP